MLTDLAPDEAESTTRELEQNMEALGTIAFPHARTPNRRTTVVVFRNDSEFHAFAPELYGGQFMLGLPNDLEPDPFVVLRERLDAATRVRFLHELTHDLFARNFGWAPPWLAEGWAQYYSTLRVDGGTAHLGEALPRITFTSETDFFVARADNGEVVTAVPTREVPKATELIAMDARAFYAPMRTPEPNLSDRQRAGTRYAGSWALVHMMLDGGEPYTPRFRAFLEQARSGETLARAWQLAFADIPPAKLDEDFRSYLARRELAVWETPFLGTSNRIAVECRPLTASDVHLLWARLIRWGGKGDADAKQDLADALAEAPDAAEPRYWLGLYALSHGDAQRAELELDQAVRAAPRDARFRLAMVRLYMQSRETSSAAKLAHAVERLAEVAESPTQLRVVASALRQLRPSEKALEFARKAYALGPIDPRVLDTYAAALFDAGQVDAAVAI